MEVNCETLGIRCCVGIRAAGVVDGRGAQAAIGVVGDGTNADSPSTASRLTEATGCVDNTSGWLGKGQNISTSSGTHWAGVIFVHIPPADPTKIPTFCTDLGTSISQGKCFVADGPTACPITWLLNNGFGPDNPATNAESAARQAAVWYFSGALTVNSRSGLRTHAADHRGRAEPLCAARVRAGDDAGTGQRDQLPAGRRGA
ncbi:MAG: hypothetical protein HZY76_13260 [Anaerolineae bacterium]|nr:MAG: hypothetical protein HZY76_13260 [Anaerolineae bacterium]